MTKVKQILGFENKGEYGLVHVLLSDGTEGTIYNGGLVEVWFDPDWNKIKVFVKKA